MNIFLRNVNNSSNTNINLTININTKIETYSQQINNLFNTSGFKLLYKGGVLDLKQPFSKYDIHENDVVLVIPNKKPIQTTEPSRINNSEHRPRRMNHRRPPVPIDRIRSTMSTSTNGDIVIPTSEVTEHLLRHMNEPPAPIDQFRSTMNYMPTGGSGVAVAIPANGGTELTNESEIIFERVTNILNALHSSTNSTETYSYETIYAAFVLFAENIYHRRLNLEKYLENDAFFRSNSFRGLVLGILSQARDMLHLSRMMNVDPEHISSLPEVTDNVPQFHIVPIHRETSESSGNNDTDDSDDTDTRVPQLHEEPLTGNDTANIQILMEFTGATEERTREVYLSCHKNVNVAATLILSENH